MSSDIKIDMRGVKRKLARAVRTVNDEMREAMIDYGRVGAKIAYLRTAPCTGRNADTVAKCLRRQKERIENDFLGKYTPFNITKRRAGRTATLDNTKLAKIKRGGKSYGVYHRVLINENAPRPAVTLTSVRSLMKEKIAESGRQLSGWDPMRKAVGGKAPSGLRYSGGSGRAKLKANGGKISFEGVNSTPYGVEDRDRMISAAEPLIRKKAATVTKRRRTSIKNKLAFARK